jgi:hypothetical protein
VCPSDDYMKLRNKYKNFLCEYRTLRKEYDDLKSEFDRMKRDKLDILDGDTSLELSSLNWHEFIFVSNFTSIIVN